MIIVPLTVEHVLSIEPQQAQDDVSVDERVATAKALMHVGQSYALLDADGVMCIAGIAHQWEGRGMAWALVSRHAGRKMRLLTRIISRYLDAVNYRRIEMYVDAQFATGCRWATMLGFKDEGRLASFMPNGNDAFMYGRVK